MSDVRQHLLHTCTTLQAGHRALKFSGCVFCERRSSLLVVAVFDEGGDVGRLRILLGSDGCELVPVPVLLQEVQKPCSVFNCTCKLQTTWMERLHHARALRVVSGLTCHPKAASGPRIPQARIQNHRQCLRQACSA